MIAVIKRTNMDSDYVEIEKNTIENLFLKTKNDSNIGEAIESISIFKDIEFLKRRISYCFDRISEIAEAAESLVEHECLVDTGYHARRFYFLIEHEMEELDKLTYAINEGWPTQEQQETE